MLKEIIGRKDLKKYLLVLFISSLTPKNIISQTDTLYNPFLYSVVPKIVDYNITAFSPYKLNFDKSNQEYKYSNEILQNLNFSIPILTDKKGWYINADLMYSWIDYNLSDSAKKSTFYQNRFRVMKKATMLNRTWYLGSTFLINGKDFYNNQKSGLILTATTPVQFKNSKISVGASILLIQGVVVPILPVVRYAGWVNKNNKILLEVSAPIFEIKIGKIINNRTRLKSGFRLANQTNFTSDKEFQFLSKNGAYELNRLNNSCFIEFEKTFYKDFWFGIEPGYNLNVNSNLKISKVNKFETNDVFAFSNAYIKVGVFFRPTKFKK